ncbi:MAG: hypothetical protein ACLGHT_02650, partial [Acidimicrobiia bacterium]
MTRGRVALVVCACVALLMGAAAPAGAKAKTPEASKKRQAEIERQIKNLRSEVAEASAEEAELLDRIVVARARRQALDTEVAALEARIRTTEGELGMAEAKLRRVEQDLVVAQAKLRSTEEHLSGARDDLRERAVAAYVGQPRSAVVGLALGVSSLRELSALRVYYRTLVQDQQEKVDRFRGLRLEIADLRAELQRARADASSERDTIAATKASLEEAKRGR